MKKGIAIIRIRAKFYNISLICAHAPTEKKNDVVKYSLYAKLKDVYDKCSINDAKIVLEDFMQGSGR